MDKLNDMKAWFAALIGALTGLWGWMGWLVLAWIVCMVLDYITGSIAAGQAGEWSSAKAWAGLLHKVGMMFVVAVAALADLVLGAVLANLPVVSLPFAYPGLVCPVVLVWYVIMEMGSIAENAVKMGAPVPGWLKKLLAAGRDAVDRAGDGMTGGEDAAGRAGDGPADGKEEDGGSDGTA